jgi:hypothetical protein
MHLGHLSVIVRKQCSLAHLDAGVAGVGVGDYLARILPFSKVPSGEFIQTKLFRPPISTVPVTVSSLPFGPLHSLHHRLP